MRTSFVMLAALAGLGAAIFGAAPAEAENLSCITGISPGEQRLLRDCEPEPVQFYVLEVVNQAPPPPPTPPEPARMKHGEGGKGGGTRGRDNDHAAPAGGGNAGGANSAAN